ncbi:MAG: hypothetical protein HY647_10005 [Acidobacteria bacterium]|nr:hypothetical protein [Acidobacteriota bacterium]
MDCTDVERTLIDIVVRPAYSGGLSAVCAAYKQAVHRIDVEYMFALLKNMEYAYPYHQSIGFLLQRAGLPEDRNPFSKKRAEFDFFLDYGINKPAYDKKWRVYYPASLK